MTISVPTGRLFVWIARRPRSYAETPTPGWRSTRAAQAAVENGLVEIDRDRVVLTTAGAALLTQSAWRAACDWGG
jgi:hypothetical protein